MITLHVNGKAQTFDGDPTMPVLWYLRDVLGLTGTKFGCGVAACGACTIHIDGEATRSCQTAMSDANGKSVTTIEGLDPEGNHPVADGLARDQCAAVRLLPGRPDHAGRRASEADAASDRLRHRQHDVRQHLPLRNLSAHSRRHQASCGSLIMTKHIRELVSASGIENVSRRGVLKGMLATGGLRARGAHCAAPVRRRRTSTQVGRRRHAARHRQQSSGFRVDRARRNRHHRLPSLRHGTGHAHRHAADRRRRNGGRLGQSESRPGDRRRSQIRQPGHRRLPFDPAFLHADAPGGRRGPHDAGGGRGETLGRGRLRRRGEEPRGHSEVDRQEARLWRPRRRRQHDGRPDRMSASKRSGARNARQPAAQGPFQVPLHRQGRDQHRRRLQHHDRSRHLWPGRPLARPEIRRHRAPGGDGRQGRHATTPRTRRRSRAFSRSSRCPRRPIR